MIHHPGLVLEVIEVMDPARIKEGHKDQSIMRCGADLAISVGRRLMASRGEGDNKDRRWLSRRGAEGVRSRSG